MLRPLTLVLVLFALAALVLTACVQPTPTPETNTTPVATSSDPGLNQPATATPEGGYPAVTPFPSPTFNLTAYPEGPTPGGRVAPSLQTRGAWVATYR